MKLKRRATRTCESCGRDLEVPHERGQGKCWAIYPANWVCSTSTRPAGAGRLPAFRSGRFPSPPEGMAAGMSEEIGEDIYVIRFKNGELRFGQKTGKIALAT